MNSLAGTRIAPFPVLLKGQRCAEQWEDHSGSDEEAMVRLQNRDHHALTVLFDRYSRLVFGIVVRVLHDAGEAEDVVQEVFTHIYQKAFLFDSEKGTARSWILRAAYRRALDRHSYLTKRRFYLSSDLTFHGDLISGTSNLECQMVARMSLDQLQQLFDDLSEVQQQTLQLFFFEGMTFQEIADKLHESLGNIRHYYYRGISKLRGSVFAESQEQRRVESMIQVKVDNHE